jgi:hypothetical protein
VRKAAAVEADAQRSGTEATAGEVDRVALREGPRVLVDRADRVAERQRVRRAIALPRTQLRESGLVVANRPHERGTRPRASVDEPCGGLLDRSVA